MNAAAHRVRRQSWRLAARSAEEAFELRARLHTALEHELPGALERAFDKAAPGAEVVHVPKLELRLRVASLDALADALAEAIARELDLQPAAPPRPVPLERRQLLLHYLEHGALAWHAAQRDAPEAAAELRATALAEIAEVARRAPAGPAAFAEAVQYFFRLLELLPVEHWSELAEAVDAIAPAVVVPGEGRVTESSAAKAITGRTVISALASAFASSKLYATRMIAAAVLAAVREPAMRGADLARAVSAALGIEAPAEIASSPPVDTLETTTVEFVPLIARLPRPAAAFFAARFVIPQGTPSDAASGPPVHTADQGQAKAPPAREAIHQSRTTTSQLPKPARTQERAAARPFAWFVSNAGLVLLHPYLPRLFEHCELYRERRLRELPRAAALLHWLATGREEVHEFELGFAKLLLGLAPDAPLAVGAGLLGRREREEGDALLRAAIEHWSTLKSTSVEALRAVLPAAARCAARGRGRLAARARAGSGRRAARAPALGDFHVEAAMDDTTAVHGLADALSANARDLEADLGWLERVLYARLKQYFGAADAPSGGAARDRAAAARRGLGVRALRTRAAPRAEHAPGAAARARAAPAAAAARRALDAQRHHAARLRAVRRAAGGGPRRLRADRRDRALPPRRRRPCGAPRDVGPVRRRGAARAGRPAAARAGGGRRASVLGRAGAVARAPAPDHHGDGAPAGVRSGVPGAPRADRPRLGRAWCCPPRPSPGWRRSRAGSATAAGCSESGACATSCARGT